jgi:putative hydrolase of HD superfamily
VSARLDAQFTFLREAEKLRRIDRQNLILDGSRVENSAEHSWHLALYAMALAPLAAPDVDVDRVIRMLLLHDLVEIDVGDHPITTDVDWAAVQRAEAVAARRLFGLLPQDQGDALLSLWLEFEAAETADARFAKQLDHCQPIFQTLYCSSVPAFHIDVVRQNLTEGRATALEHSFPKAFHHAKNLLGEGFGESCPDFTARLGFLNEADALKQVLRASKLGDGSRRENSAEHSWHIMLHGWILAEHAAHDIDVARVLRMLLLHDIVEIDAGDTPIHGQQDPAALAAIEEKEAAAATRLFNLLPAPHGTDFHTLWSEFEAAQSPDAIFAKSIDRVQPLFLNLVNGGGSWVEYDVSLSQLEERVGLKVARGAPDVWHYVQAEVRPWFEAAGRV